MSNQIKVDSMKKIQIVIFLSLFSIVAGAQELAQTIRGRVVDMETGAAVFGASVFLTGTDPLIGTVSNINGEFRLENVKIGRYDLKTTYIGYEPYLMTEVFLTSSREVILDIRLVETSISMEGVEIRARTNKEKPLNSMSIISSRQISVEEARRYAGGVDDISRVASAFAGVGSDLASNGIVIRGNSPKGILWQMEGIKIPNPNHFANLTVFGGGAFTALSSQLLDNSDFYTSAFPAEFSNGLSGVFDINMRTGNNENYEHTFQLGTVGIDVASEGPINKSKQSSYIFNYRYSTFTLLEPLLPENAGAIRYQDLAFKLNFPMRTGSLSVWGLGAMDKSGMKAETNTEEWTYPFDNQEGNNKSKLAAAGISYKNIFGKKTSMNNSFAVSGNALTWEVEELSTEQQFTPKEDIYNDNWKYTFSSTINHKISQGNTIRAGIILNHMAYNINIKHTIEPGDPLTTIVSEKGNSQLYQGFLQSRNDIGKHFVFNAGLHFQYFALNNNTSAEPRLGLRYNINGNQSITVGYGNHGQLEMLNIYFAQQTSGQDIIYPNKNLEISRAHHFVLGYEIALNEHMRLMVEPYYQKLYNIPVIDDSSFSLINLDQDWYINDAMVSDGTGQNMGIDITFERFMHKGYYFMISGSVFDSRYEGGDGVDRSTRFNKGYILNLLGGKEWKVGKAKNNVIGLSGRFKYQGGNHYSPVDFNATEAMGDIVYDASRAFEEQWPDVAHLHLTFNYTRNKAKHASIWSFQLVNLLAAKEYYGHKYNMQTAAVEVDQEVMFFPNISYKIEF